MERMEKLLYEASLEGNQNTLLMLLQEDPLILDRVTLNHHGDTPLHIASMLGHMDFIKEVITRKPHLAMERDSQTRLPLHIASAKGHVEIVKLLISANPEACLARDRDGVSAIHLAAIKGQHEVVKELVYVQPHAARALVQQDTILHLCVKHNQVEVLKLLIEAMCDHEFINSRDAHGNTILHLAVADKQVQTINFLLLTTTIEVNATNTNGETSMDILAGVSRDLKYQQILQSLTRAGGLNTNIRAQGSFQSVPRSSKTKPSFNSIEYHKKPTSAQYVREELVESDDWLNRKRSSLMVVASLIATMAFQAGTNPPSGVWQDDLSTDPLHQAGFAVMPSNHPTLYHVFLVCNTTGFVSTLSIILLLISGLPFLKHRVFLWVLLVTMWIATTSMSITYLVSIWVLTPTPQSELFRRVAVGITGVWIALMSLLIVGHTVRIITGAMGKLLHRKRTILVQMS